MSEFLEVTIHAPKKQAIVVALISLLFMLMGYIANFGDLFAWQSSAAGLLLFIVYNSVYAIFADSFKVYALESMTWFLGTVIGLAVISTLVSGVSIQEDEAYRVIYLVIMIAYTVLLAGALFIRSIYRFLQERE